MDEALASQAGGIDVAPLGGFVAPFGGLLPRTLTVFGRNLGR